MKSILAIASFAFFFTASAFAQEAPSNEGGDGAAPASSENVQNYDFTGDDIDGDVIKPDGEDVGAQRRIRYTSLIRVREDFIREILKSAEDL